MAVMTKHGCLYILAIMTSIAIGIKETMAVLDSQHVHDGDGNLFTLSVNNSNEVQLFRW